MKDKTAKQTNQTPAASENGVRPQVSRRRQREIVKAARRRRTSLVRWGTRVTVAVLLLGAVAFFALARFRTSSPAGPDGLPGPLGGPSVAQDVNTLVGKAAPGFTLSDSEGKSYAITPGSGRPVVLVFHMGITWQLCVQQLGELQKSAEALQERADVYVINGDTPQDSRRVKQITKISVPVLLDRELAVAQEYDLLPKPGQPMGMMRGVAQMSWVIIDANGTIRIQRADINFGDHAGQMLEILQWISQGETARTP